MPTAVILRPGGWSGTGGDGSLHSTLTRLHPMHPLTRSAPHSLDPVSALLPHFGKKHNHYKSSLSILSNQPESPVVDQNQEYVFHNHDAYRKVCDWFEYWRDWQKKILLCGITNR